MTGTTVRIIHSGWLPDSMNASMTLEGCVRLNFATSRPLLTRALEQMAQALREG
jgi:bifunctional pyridoxal-dependent enzyme with beta-cystathionase and maltose regulon repressor activities